MSALAVQQHGRSGDQYQEASSSKSWLVVEATGRAAAFNKHLEGLAEIADATGRQSKLDSALSSGEWVCGEKGIESATTAVHALFSNQTIADSFQTNIEKQSDKRMEDYAALLQGEIPKAQKAALLLADIRSNGHLDTELGVNGFRVFTFDETAFFSSEQVSLISYFAEAALNSGRELSRDQRVELQAHLTPDNKTRRLGALLTLAVSSDPLERELYRQIVLTLPKPLLRELTSWIKNVGIDTESPAECTVLRLDRLLLKSPALEKALRSRELQKTLAQRLIKDPHYPLAESLVGNSLLQVNILPQLFGMAQAKDRRMPKIVEQLTPQVRGFYDALSAQMHLSLPADQAGILNPVKPIPSSPERTPRVEMEKVADVLEALEDRSWYCDANSYSSPRGDAQQALMTDAGLREKFIATESKNSKLELGRLLAHYQSGGLSREGLVEQLEEFQSRFHITEEAFAARDILIGLEMDQGLKRVRQIINASIAVGVGNNAGPSPVLSAAEFKAIALAGLFIESHSPETYRRIVLDLDPHMAKAYLEYFPPQGDESTACVALSLPEEARVIRDMGNRAEAMRKLTKFWPVTADIVSQGAIDVDDRMRLKIAQALFNVPRIDAEAIKLLILLSRDHSPFVRAAALDGLVKASERDKAALVKHIPEILPLLKNDSIDERSTAAKMLGNLGPLAKEAVPHLAAALGETEPNWTVLRALGEMGETAAPHFVAVLQNPNYRNKHPLMKAMGEFGLVANPVLIEALRFPVFEIRAEAAQRLGEIGKEFQNREAVPHLATALNDPDESVRWRAAEALGAIGPLASQAVPALAAGLKDRDWAVRWNSAQALGQIGPLAKAAVPDLIGVLANPSDSSLVLEAVLALDRIGVAAKPLLLAAIDDKDPQVRGLATLALLQIKPVKSGTVLKIAALLKDPNALVRRNAVVVLGKMGSTAKIVLPDLIATFNDESALVRESAGSALPSVGEAAVPALIAALTDKASRIRVGAAYALGGLKSAEAVAPLGRTLVEDPESSVRVAAVSALRTMGEAARPAMPQLVTALKDENPKVRERAEYVLVNLGQP